MAQRAADISNLQSTTAENKKPQRPLHFHKSDALQFSVWFKCSRSMARRSEMILPHGVVDTPVFMPVGTQGTMKGLLCSEMYNDISCQIHLSNTYHLALRPTTPVIDKLGGIHKFIKTKCNILTDSGGFQMVSLLELAEFSEEGVTFQSPVDGTEMLLTPEKSIQCQNEIGSDIMMALDDVVPATCDDPKRVEEATHRSIRWLGRCIAAHRNPKKQNLFGIIQGGLDPELRKHCLSEMVKQFDSKLPGYAIGGLSGGEAKDDFWRTVLLCTQHLPPNKPRYCMGVGYPLDLIVCVALGVDMFDCVYPGRTARFGTAMTDNGELKLKKKEFLTDYRVIDEDCPCSTCQRGKGYSRAYLHQISCVKQSNAAQLLTIHNVTYLCRFMQRIRTAIKENTFHEFVRQFMRSMFADEAYPQWAVDAFNAVGIHFDEKRSNDK